MPNYNFRGYTYTTLDVTIGTGIFRAYLDGSCLITFIDRSKLLDILPDAVIKRMPSTIKVKGIADAIYNSSEYILIILKVSN